MLPSPHPDAVRFEVAERVVLTEPWRFPDRFSDVDSETGWDDTPVVVDVPADPRTPGAAPGRPSRVRVWRGQYDAFPIQETRADGSMRTTDRLLRNFPAGHTACCFNAASVGGVASPDGAFHLLVGSAHGFVCHLTFRRDADGWLAASEASILDNLPGDLTYIEPDAAWPWVVIARPFMWEEPDLGVFTDGPAQYDVRTRSCRPFPGPLTPDKGELWPIDAIDVCGPWGVVVWNNGAALQWRPDTDQWRRLDAAGWVLGTWNDENTVWAVKRDDPCDLNRLTLPPDAGWRVGGR